MQAVPKHHELATLAAILIHVSSAMAANKANIQLNGMFGY
jgi:hypothetical protein